MLQGNGAPIQTLDLDTGDADYKCDAVILHVDFQEVNAGFFKGKVKIIIHTRDKGIFWWYIGPGNPPYHESKIDTVRKVTHIHDVFEVPGQYRLTLGRTIEIIASVKMKPRRGMPV